MLNFSQFGLPVVVLLVGDKHRDFPKSCAAVSEVLDDALKWWMCFACVLEAQTFALLSLWPWDSFPGGVCALSPPFLAPRNKRSRFVLWRGQAVGQAGTLVPCDQTYWDEKRIVLLLFLFLRNIASQLKWAGAFGVSQLHLSLLQPPESPLSPWAVQRARAGSALLFVCTLQPRALTFIGQHGSLLLVWGTDSHSFEIWPCYFRESAIWSQ